MYHVFTNPNDKRNDSNCDVFQCLGNRQEKIIMLFSNQSTKLNACNSVNNITSTQMLDINIASRVKNNLIPKNMNDSFKSGLFNYFLLLDISNDYLFINHILLNKSLVFKMKDSDLPCHEVDIILTARERITEI